MGSKSEKMRESQSHREREIESGSQSQRKIE